MGMPFSGQRGLHSAMSKSISQHLREISFLSGWAKSVTNPPSLSTVEFLEDPSQNPGFQATNDLGKLHKIASKSKTPEEEAES